ncbi:MAG: hypothetical protein PHV30_01880 [Candidatus Margulisbacteria bacterium]|nr:hypothetical protein [Candidatus Margulisiibacteriota bacterium]
MIVSIVDIFYKGFIYLVLFLLIAGLASLPLIFFAWLSKKISNTTPDKAGK